MDFLKSAVASAISKGSGFPYAFGDKVEIGTGAIEESVWDLYNGTRREDGSKCSIFTNKNSLTVLAKNAVRKLRTLRHPGVIKVLETIETDTGTYVATERLVPLNWHIRRKSLNEETIKWGLYSISKTLSFIHNEATSVHGNVRPVSIFTTESGEWKLGGFELLTSPKEASDVHLYSSSLTGIKQYAPPELAKSGRETIMDGPIYAADAYSLGVLIYEVFNGTVPASGQIGQTNNIPRSMHQCYKKLLNSNPKARMSVANFVIHGQRPGSFFDGQLIRLTEGLENLGLKSQIEREDYLEQLSASYEDFPDDFLKMKVLPELLKAAEYAGGGPQVLSLAIKIGAKLPDDDFEVQMAQNLIRLFASPDRATRVCLLDSLPLYVDRFSQKTVNDKIFPQIVTGFTDITPVVREQTVKSILSVAPKLSDRTLNGELLRHLAKTANDEQPGIRTNTTICLGKIARNLSSSTRTKVLTAAFARALRDPFVHARNASLMALGATVDLFSDDDCAAKILPGICPMLVDKERIVRDQANKTLEIYLQRVRKYSQTLPETALPTSSTNAQPTVSAPRSENTRDTWTGWAISSFTNKVAGVRGEIQTDTNGASSARPALVARSETARPASTANDIPQKPISLGSLPTSTAQSSASLPIPFFAENNDNETSDNSLDNPLDSTLPEEWANEPDPLADPLQPSISRSTTFNPWADADSNDNAAAPFSTTAKENVDEEPDFAGWLAAQSKNKSKGRANKVLPKGLAPSTSSGGAATKRPSISGRAATTGSTVTSTKPPKKKPIVGGARPKAPGAKVGGATDGSEVAEPAAGRDGDKKVKDKEEEDDGWGDDWA